MLKLIYYGMDLDWRIVLVDIICVCIFSEYIVHMLKRLNANFRNGVSLHEGESDVAEIIRLSIFLLSLRCTSPVLMSLLVVFTLLVVIAVMASIRKKDKEGKYTRELEGYITRIWIFGGIALLATFVMLTAFFE